MFESEKVDEAKYFCRQLASASDDIRLMRYNLSAFLNALRSALTLVYREARVTQHGRAWANQIRTQPWYDLLKHLRDANLHDGLVRVVARVRTSDTDTPSLGLAFNKNAQPDEWVPVESVTVVSGLEMDTVILTLPGWPTEEHFLTACSRLLTQVDGVIADGVSKRFLRPRPANPPNYGAGTRR